MLGNPIGNIFDLPEAATKAQITRQVLITKATIEDDSSPYNKNNTYIYCFQVNTSSINATMLNVQLIMHISDERKHSPCLFYCWKK